MIKPDLTTVERGPNDVAGRSSRGTGVEICEFQIRVVSAFSLRQFYTLSRTVNRRFWDGPDEYSESFPSLGWYREYRDV